MKPSDVYSAGWLLVLLVIVTATAMHRAEAKQADLARKNSLPDVQYAQLPNGERGIVDASGEVIPLRPYRRIGGVSTVADALLLALSEPERIDSLSFYGSEHSEAPHLYGSRNTINSLGSLEALIERKVDLLIINDLRNQARLSRARESGIQIFNLGDMRGLSTLLPNIAAVAALLGHPERGRAYADKLVLRMRQVAADVPMSQRKSALYLSAYANQLLGGAGGSSYHDVLTHAGLRDVTDGKYTGWPHYDPEQVLELDPDLIVVSEGSARALCAMPGLARVRACDGGMIELAPDLLGDPGPRMLDAAEALRNRVYGAPKPIIGQPPRSGP